MQLSAPLIQFPAEELPSIQASETSSIGFSSGSGHDLEGDSISVAGKNWTVRGESILDYWSSEIRSVFDANATIDMYVNDLGVGYACSVNASDVNLHILQLNGTFETMLVESLTAGSVDECAIGITKQDRFQVVYNVDSDIKLARLALKNAVYVEPTWHLRTIAEDIYSSGLTISLDSESKTHIVFQDSDSALHHLWFNKAFWNHTILDNGPVGDDIEVQIDSSDMLHIAYTNSAEGELRLIKFNDTTDIRQVLARNSTITSAIGMDLDSNNIEQITYSKSDGLGNNTISLLRSLTGKDTGRIDPNPKWIINYDDDSVEGDLVAGDLNGDGYDDLLYSDPDGNGTISIHYGSPDGPGDLADRILVGSFSDSMLGTGIAVGDFNCDGYDDLASSEPGFSNNNSGYISIRLGSSAGISDIAWWDMNGSVDDNLGWSMTSLGDVESDGCDDLAVVADKMIQENTATPSLSQNGLVMILKGNATSMIHHTNITQTGSGTMFGRQVIGNGDINGDGFMDMVVSNTGTVDSPTGYSSVEFFLGNSSGINSTAVKVHAPLTQGKLYGSEMSFLGDVDGDGFDDVLVGELFADGNLYHAGKVHMWAGSNTGPVTPSQGSWSLKGSYANALLGSTISAAGDINEDGFDDFFLMAPSPTKSGKVELYLGSQNGPRSDTQVFAQGSTGENVGLNILSGIDLNGDGMGEIIYSSRDLTRGENFGPVLTIMSERDWEFVDFSFEHPVLGIEMHASLRGSPSLLVHLSDDSMNIMESTLDGTPSGRWVIRNLGYANEVDMGISSSGKPLVMALTNGLNSNLVTMTVHGNTGLDYSLDSGTGLGKEMGSAQDSNGNIRLGYSSPDYSSIFYTEETSNGFTKSTVKTSIDLEYPIQMHVDENDLSRMIFVDDDDKMIHLATLNGTWTEEPVLNTTIGDDFDTAWNNETLLITQIAVSNNSSMLQLVEYENSTSIVTDIVQASLSSTFEIEVLDEKIIVSLMDSDFLTIYERSLSGGNWTTASSTWLLGETTGHSLAMDGQYVLFDANNTLQGLLIEDGTGQWDLHNLEIPDSLTSHELLVDDGRLHITSTDGLGQLIWTTGELSQTDLMISTSFPSITTDYSVPMEFSNDKLIFAYSQASTDNFLLMAMVSDLDRDLIPDSHDDKPMIGNQWEDSDSDGFGDNPLGPSPDSCPATTGTSIYDRFGCEDYDEDGWSDSIDDCVNDDGMSWWGRVGCTDYDQDGWVDDGIVGDRYPQNWKQALDSDRDSFGDNHGPDCCDVILVDGSLEQSPPDAFPYNHMQWEDLDGDGYGDNDSDIEFGDKCYWVEGYSWRDRLGCVDTDGDGASDPSDFGSVREWTEADGADWWPNDSTQWADSDGDGFGDNSSDGATNPDKFPNKPAAANDTDNDGYPDNWTPLENGSNHQGLFLDNCPLVYGNSTSAVVETVVNDEIVRTITPYYGCSDRDGDGREDLTDAFPDEPTQTEDRDGDGWGDNQNGVDPDACPSDYGVINGTKPDGTLGVGCPLPTDEEDSDSDNVPDDIDECNNTQIGQTVDSVGCSEYQKDDDQDGVFNAEDMCSGTPIEESVDEMGCSDNQKLVDSDNDGVNDPQDSCTDTEIGKEVDSNGCADNQRDTDGDGYLDSEDDCDDTPAGYPTLANGCTDESGFDEDIDGDTFKGEYSYDPENDPKHVGDAFPTDGTQWENMDGDAYGDNPQGNNPDSCPFDFGTSSKILLGCLDSDGDGYPDGENDPFPEDPTQWEDDDRDGFGDNASGNNADQCLGTNWVDPVAKQQAESNSGCAENQLDSDADGIMDDMDQCDNTQIGAKVDAVGCIIEDNSKTISDDGELILGMDLVVFMVAAGSGGLVLLVAVVFLVLRSRGGDDFDFDDDDEDDWYEEEDNFMSNIGGGFQSRGPPVGAVPSRGPMGGPNRGPPVGAVPSRGPVGGPNRGPPGGAVPSRGPVGVPNRGPPGGPVPSRGPGGPNRGPPAGTGLDPRGPARGKKVAKRKPIDSKVKKSKVIIDPDLFSQDELADRVAAIDWTKGALKDGENERTILMQLQTTGWSAPQSRAIIDLSKQ